MIGLPTKIAFVSREDDINVNGSMSNQHPLNDQERECYPGADYTNYCTREDFDNFDWLEFLNLQKRKGYKLVKKTKDVFVYRDNNNRIAALVPV